MLLVWLLVLIFTTLAPIMYGAGFLYFGARLLEAKTSVLYRHEPLYESAARWWPAARHRVVFSLYCAQLTLVLVVALKQAPGPAVLTAALVPLTALGSDLMRRSYDSFAPHNPQPLQQYPGGAAALADVAPLAAAYLPLALQPPEGPLREELQAELAAAAAEKAAAEAAAKAAAVGPAPPGDEELGKQD